MKFVKIVKIAGSWSCIDIDVRILPLLLCCCVVVTEWNKKLHSLVEEIES
jgi:hypothetical protein